jgi:hypothetical protein
MGHRSSSRNTGYACCLGSRPRRDSGGGKLMGLIIVVAVLPLLTLHMWAIPLWRKHAGQITCFLICHLGAVASQLIRISYGPHANFLVATTYYLVLMIVLWQIYSLARYFRKSGTRPILSQGEHASRAELDSYRYQYAFGLAVGIQVMTLAGHTPIVMDFLGQR